MPVGPQNQADFRRPADLAELDLGKQLKSLRLQHFIDVLIGGDKMNAVNFPVLHEQAFPGAGHDLDGQVPEIHQLQVLDIEKHGVRGSLVQLLPQDLPVEGHPLFHIDGEGFALAA